MNSPYYQDSCITIYNGDSLSVLKELPSNSVNCCITSPPYYGLRSYLPDGVVPKKDCPKWVIDKLKEINVCPVDKTHNNIHINNNNNMEEYDQE